VSPKGESHEEAHKVLLCGLQILRLYYSISDKDQYATSKLLKVNKCFTKLRVSGQGSVYLYGISLLGMEFFSSYT
jgi:hypothetical protein